MLCSDPIKQQGQYHCLLLQASSLFMFNEQPTSELVAARMLLHWRLPVEGSLQLLIVADCLGPVRSSLEEQPAERAVQCCCPSDRVQGSQYDT